MKTLYTPRLILRQFNKADANDFFEYAQNPNIGPNAGWKPHESKEESRMVLERFITGQDEYAIVYKENGKVIGSLGFYADKVRSIIGAYNIGYVLHEAYWGRGLMPEAVHAVLEFLFVDYVANVVSVAHFPQNMRSRRVIEKCGFVYEGTLRHVRRLYNGQMMDCMTYSMLKEEYFTMYPVAGRC